MNRYFLQLLISFLFITTFHTTKIFGQSEKPETPIFLEHSVDRDKITIGDLIKYSVIVRHNPDIEVQMPPPAANLGMFEIRDYNIADPRKENKQLVQQTDYLISTFETGEFEIPPLGIGYTMAGDTTVHELHTESIKITIESMKPSEEGDIRDIKMPLEIPRNYRQLIFIIVVSVLVVAIGVLSYFFIKRYKEGKSLIPRRVKPPRPPHEVALEELEKLIASDLLTSGEIKKYYVTISDIIRRYIEGRFFIVALEMTTTQLLDNMRQANIEADIVGLTEEFLDSCDLVKFAKYIPTDEENEQVIHQAFDLVNHTKLVIEEAVEVVDDEEEKTNIASNESEHPEILEPTEEIAGDIVPEEHDNTKEKDNLASS